VCRTIEGIKHLFSIPFSLNNSNTISFNGLFETAIGLVKDVLQDFILCADRAFGNVRWIEFFVENNINFLVRMMSSVTIRIGSYEGKIRQIYPQLLKYTKTGQIITWKGKKRWVGYAGVRVMIPEIEGKEFTLIVVTGKKEPLFLLTNLKVGEEVSEIYIINTYFDRWSVEEVIRFAKQEVGIEEFMVRKFHAIKNLVILASLAVSFIISMQEMSQMMQKYVLDKSLILPKKHRKREWYRLIDGFRRILHMRWKKYLKTCQRFIARIVSSSGRYRLPDSLDVKLMILLGV
jgi:hypothetical protein